MEHLQVHSGGVPQARRPILALYRAVVRLKVEYSSFHVHTEVSEINAWARLEQRPALQSPYNWPPELTGIRFRDLQILALAKIKVIFDIDALLPDLMPDEMRQAAYRRFLKVKPDAVKPRVAESYTRFFIEAGAYEDGNVFWERSVESDRHLPPGLTGAIVPERPEDSDVEVFLKTLVRADLIERMDLLRQ